MRLPGSGQALEERRWTAVRMRDLGFDEEDVRAVVGCSRSSLFRWQHARSVGGPEALRVKKSPGRPSRLLPEQQQQLLKYLGEGAIKHSFGSDLWTCARVAELIQQSFGVSYHADYIGPLLRRLGWSPQMPERRAAERDDQDIARWRTERWPSIRKKPKNAVPASRSATRQVSSSCRPVAAPGHQSGRRR